MKEHPFNSIIKYLLDTQNPDKNKTMSKQIQGDTVALSPSEIENHLYSITPSDE